MAQAQIAVQPPPGFRNTPHNLRAGVLKGDPDEICVFCHTPQQPESEGPRSGGPAPIWQPSVTMHSFVMFDDIGRLQFGNKPAVGSQSMACLSCHDSAQAFGVTGSQQDHPFGVPYRGWTRDRRVSPWNETPEGSAAPMVARAALTPTYLDYRLPSSGMIDNRSVWWVSANGITVRRTRQDLPLYARRTASDDEVPYIECSSCHDPHSPNPLFLRVVNDGSKLCLTCHDK
ncbi:MAG: hypothetical protein FIB06_11355 [Betaproteobacteria bacterium]|nr:hypothetical protein [Betaproteobacteria bacterium]